MTLKFALNTGIIGMCHYAWHQNQPLQFALCFKRSYYCSGGVNLFTHVFELTLVFMAATGCLFFFFKLILFLQSKFHGKGVIC